MSNMETLPTKILPNIILSLSCESSLAALALTNRRFHHLSNPILYQHNVLHNKSSALSWAAQTGRLDTFQKALDAGAPLPDKEPAMGCRLSRPPPTAQTGLKMMRSFHGFQPHPISLAAENGNEHLVRFMVGRGVSPNTRNSDGHTVLALAALHGHASLVDYLLQVGARQEIRSFNGQRPICLAAFQGHLDVVNLLLSAATEREEPFVRLMPYNVKCMSEDLFQENHSPFFQGRDGAAELGPTKVGLITQALYAAINAGQVHVARALLMHEIEVNVFYPDVLECPLDMATRNGHSELVSLLLEYGADPNLVASPRTSMAPLTAAVIAGNEHLVPILLPATSGLQRTRALAFAITKGDRSLVKILLDSGAPPQFKPEDIPSTAVEGGWPGFAWPRDWIQPLLLAVQGKNYELVEVLLDSGADVDVLCPETGASQAENQNGRQYDRVLFRAVDDADEAIVHLLLERGADPEVSDSMGLSPLSCAVQSGNEAILQLLLEHGANPHRAVDYIGRKLRSLEQIKESLRVRLLEAEAKWK